MAIEMLYLTRCPYCSNGIGEMLFSVAELPSFYNYPPSQSFDFSDVPEQRLFVFNSSLAERGPCPHLLQVWGHCGAISEGGPEHHRRNWELDFDWAHPVYRRHETDALASFIFEIALHPDVPKHFRGDLAIDECSFRREWHAIDGAYGMSRFFVQGRALYAPDIPLLYDRAPGLVDAYERARASATC